MKSNDIIYLRSSVLTQSFLIGGVLLFAGPTIWAPAAAQATPAKLADGKKPEIDLLLQLLRSESTESIRKASVEIQKIDATSKEELESLAEAVKSVLGAARDVTAERELRMALGKLAAAGAKDTPDWSLETIEWGFESMSISHRPTTPPEVFESHVRALEMVPGAAKELLIGNLDVAVNFPGVEPMERQRLLEFVTLTAEGMRTGELASFLDGLLTGDEDLFVDLPPPLQIRMIGCYTHIKAEKPTNADAVVKWLTKHPRRAAQLEIAALEAISTLGATDAEFAPKLAQRLLTKLDNAERIGRGLLDGKINRSLLPQFKSAFARFERSGSSAELRRLAKSLGVDQGN